MVCTKTRTFSTNNGLISVDGVENDSKIKSRLLGRTVYNEARENFKQAEERSDANAVRFVLPCVQVQQKLTLRLPQE